MPEIHRHDLTVGALRSAIRHHGSILVRGLVDRSDVDRLVQDIDTAFDAFDAEANGEAKPDLAGWYERFDPDRVSDRVRRRSQGNLTAVESPPTLFDLIEILDKAGIRQLADEYFGEPPMLLARKATLRRIPHNGSGGWHQDGAFMGAGIRSLNIWLSLSHCGDDAPGLDVVGRRFDELVQTGDRASPKVGSGYADWGVSPENAEKAGGDAIVRPIFEAGDALIFDHLLLHRTGTDPGMTKGRYATETWLFAPSTYGAMTTPTATGYSPRDQLPILF
ncbi:MAG: phytanoyl-CoA dioxygenase family protein [Acidimicrobiia bacterium]|nr:phytanoyl-CoA dioxygenase family protein [Acidimicrobiia bacterium]